MKTHNGFTLIELMISVVLGMIIISAAGAMFVSSVDSSSNMIRSSRLNHDLETIMAIMVNDIRRAGFWGGAVIDSNSINNPFTQATTDLQVLETGACILYSYDGGSRNGGVINDGSGAVDNNEFYGFKLDNNIIRMRRTGTTTADCDDGGWEAISLGDIVEVTSLTFDISASKCLDVDANTSWDTPCADQALTAGNRIVETRQVDINLVGRLVSDNTMQKELNETIKIRTDRVFIAS